MREVAVSAVLWFFLLDEGDDGLRHPTPPPSHACGKKIWAPSLLLYSSSFHAGYNYPTEAPPPCFVHKSPWEFSRVFIREFVGRRLIVQYYCEACAQQFPFFFHSFQGRHKELFFSPCASHLREMLGNYRFCLQDDFFRPRTWRHFISRTAMDLILGQNHVFPSIKVRLF